MNTLLKIEPKFADARPFDDYSEYARAKNGLHDSWQWYRIECDPDGVRMPKDVTKLIGCVAYAKKNGTPDFGNPIAGTEQTVWINMHELRAWQEAREQEEQKCLNCREFPGQEPAGWSRAEGRKFRKCHRCNGTPALGIK